MQICRLMPTMLIEDACRKVGISWRSCQNWIQRDTSGKLARLYAHARAASAYVLEKEALDVAKHSKGKTWSRDRLYVDTLKWAAAHRAPKIFSDKMDITSGNKPMPTKIKVKLVKASVVATRRRSARRDTSPDPTSEE